MIASYIDVLGDPENLKLSKFSDRFNDDSTVVFVSIYNWNKNIAPCANININPSSAYFGL